MSARSARGPKGGDVTVVIPTFNRAPLLAETLRSIVAQTLRTRVIVVDDCSTDHTGQVCASVPDVEYVRNERRLGLFANWNRALKLVESELVALYHDDDIYEASIVETERALMQRYPDVVMVHTGCRYIDDDGRTTGSFIGTWPRLMEGEQFGSVLAGHVTSPIAAPSVMLRTDAVRRIGYFDEALRVSGDLKAWVRLGRLGKIGFVPEALVSIRHRGRYANLHASFDWEIIGEHLRVAEETLLLVRGSRSPRFMLSKDVYIAQFLVRELLIPTPGHGAEVARTHGSKAIRGLSRLIPALSHFASLTRLDRMLLSGAARRVVGLGLVSHSNGRRDRALGGAVGSSGSD